MAVSLDMLSLLPDPLLIIIISLLPFKEAVRTSVFSKSWCNKKLFKLTTSVEFNELFFVKSSNLSIRKQERKAFLDFITFWIDNNKEPLIEKFSLKLSMPKNVRELTEKCIAFATHKGGVKELELDFSVPNWNEDKDGAAYKECKDPMFDLPEHVYELRGIQTLKLHSCSFVVENLQNFHSLKEVSFGWMELSVFDINYLLSNCTMIESLSLKRCWDDSSEFSVRDENQKLKKLVVEDCDYEYDHYILVAPNLKFLKYSGPLPYFDVKECQQMEEADLDFDPVFPFDVTGNLHNFLENFYSLKVLSVSSYLLQVIATGDDEERIERKFNVRHLTVNVEFDNYEFDGIIFMLRSCPMLQRLTIQPGIQVCWDCDEKPIEKNYWKENVNACECLKSSLEVVEVKGFNDFDKNEIQMLESFILYGKVLKKMTINMERDITPPRFAESLFTIPKASSDLEITIC